MDGVADLCNATPGLQHRYAAPVMQVKMLHEIAQRGTNVGGVQQHESCVTHDDFGLVAELAHNRW